jgi:hypothetical protein
VRVCVWACLSVKAVYFTEMFKRPVRQKRPKQKKKR